VNDENWPPTFCPATQLACCKIASGVPDAAGPSPAAADGAALAVTDGAADPDAGVVPGAPVAPTDPAAEPAPDGGTDAAGGPAGCDACPDAATADEDRLLPELPLAVLDPDPVTRVRVAS